MEIEELVQYYDGFIEIVKQTAMPVEEQIVKLRGTAIADEIALDFSEIGMQYAKILLENGWITEEQFLIAKSIDKDFEGMSQKKELWSEEALLTAREWKECREKAREILMTLR